MGIENELLIGLAVAGGTLVLLLGGLYALQYRLPARNAVSRVLRSVHGTHATNAPRFGSWHEARLAFYRLALNVPESAPGAPASLIKAITRSLETAVDRPEYLPRRPQLIPRLLRALNDDATTRDELCDIILQDPVLSGDVLQRANSSYYRIWAQPVDRIDRAVRLLGVDGLKAVVASSVMRPVFNVPQELSPAFATLIWEHALCCAEAAGMYAEKTGSADRFSAHLLGLLSVLGSIVLFRLSLEAQVDSPESRAGAVLTILVEHDIAASMKIAHRWELAENLTQALEEQLKGSPVNTMSPLGTALHFGRVCGTLALLHQNGLATAEECRHSASQLELNMRAFDPIWSKLARARDAVVANA